MAFRDLGADGGGRRGAQCPGRGGAGQRRIHHGCGCGDLDTSEKIDIILPALIGLTWQRRGPEGKTRVFPALEADVRA